MYELEPLSDDYRPSDDLFDHRKLEEIRRRNKIFDLFMVGAVALSFIATIFNAGSQLRGDYERKNTERVARKALFVGQLQGYGWGYQAGAAETFILMNQSRNPITPQNNFRIGNSQTVDHAIYRSENR